MSASESRSVIVLELAEEFLGRYRRGERPSLKEYIDRHPELAAEIREVFPAVALMENVALADESLAEDTTGTAAASGAAPPEQLGDYRILREVGRGGMGIVYEAQQVSLGRHVALKVLPRKTFVEDSQRRRFEREARAAARLHHTNIVPVFGVGEHDGMPYYVMQFIQGLGLDQVCAELRRMQGGGEAPAAHKGGTAADAARSLMTGVFQGPSASGAGGASPPSASEGASTPRPGEGDKGKLPASFTLSSSSVTLPGSDGSGGRVKRWAFWQSVARIGVQVAGALEYAHRQGILHRDIKPSNLLLDAAGTVWVTDFGLARADNEDHLTQTGDIVGTLRYMPPEAFEGGTDVRGDLYSLGLTLYELLALRPAFAQRERHKLVKQVTTEEPPRLDKLERSIPRDLVTVVQKAIDRDPARRYQTAGELAADLQRFLDDEPIRARRISRTERLARWYRHHPGVAMLTAALAVILLIVTAVSLVAAARFDGLARQQTATARAAVEARDDAQAARRKLEITLTDMYTSHGLIADGRGDTAQAMLWFANAARLTGPDSERALANRIRTRTWGREIAFPVAALTHDGRDLQVLAFHPGGNYLLTLTASKRCFVWNWRDEEALRWANGDRAVSAACWSADGRWLALGLPSGEVEIRAVPSGAVLHRLQHPGEVSALAFSRDGRRLAVASHVVRVWDCRDKEFLTARWRHPKPVHSLTFNPRGDRLATACRDEFVRVFAVTGSPPAETPLFAPVPHRGGRAGHLIAPVFIDGGRGLVTLANNAELAWLDAETGRPAGFGRIRMRVIEPESLAASHDGNWFACGGAVPPSYFGPQVWNVARKDAAGTLLSHANEVAALAFSADDRALLSVSWDRTAKLWSVPDGRLLGYPLAHQDMVLTAAFSPDGRFLATGQRDGLVRIWRRPADHPGVRSLPHAHLFVDLKPSRDGRHVIPGRCTEPYGYARMGCSLLRVYDMVSGQPGESAPKLQGECIDAVLGGDGRSAAAVVQTGLGGKLYVWDFHTGKAAFPPLSLPAAPLCVAFNLDGSRLAVLCASGRILVIDPRQGRVLHEFGLEGWARQAVSFLPCRFRLLFSADESIVVLHTDYSIHVRDPRSGTLRYAPIRLNQKQGWCAGFRISGDGRLLAAAVGAAKNNPVQVWDLETGKPLSPLLPHADVPFGMRFSPDGRWLFTGCRDGQARLWDWQTGRLVCPPCKVEDEVFDVAFTPDGRWGLTAARMDFEKGGRVRMWEFTTGKPVSPTLYVGKQCALTLAISPDGDRALTAMRDGGLAWIDLSPLSAPDNLNPDDLGILAELASGQRIHEGDLAGLTSDEWLARWRKFRERHPDYGTKDSRESER